MMRGKAIKENILYKVSLILARHVAPKMKPRFMIIEPINICNLRCKMCPYKLMMRKKSKMSMELSERIIDDVIRFGIKEVRFAGWGEPTLDNLLFDRIIYAKRKGLIVGLTTNATLLNEKIASNILETDMDYIIFSFDGVSKETYERIRIGADFERTIENIRRLVKYRNERGLNRPVINVNIVLQDDNRIELPKFKNFWKNYADGISVGEGYNLIAPLTYNIKRAYPCFRLFHEIMVMSDGKVPLCCVDYNGEVILGDLKSQTLEEIWASEKLKEIQKLHLKGEGYKIEICEKCDCLYIYKTWWILEWFRTQKPFSIIYPTISKIYRRIK